jgi:hypothetical protein
MFEDMAKRNRLPLRQLVRLHEDVAMDRTLSPLLDPSQLRCKTFNEELRLAGQVHAPVAYALDGSIERWAIPIVVLADGGEPLEVVSRPIQTERG